MKPTSQKYSPDRTERKVSARRYRVVSRDGTVLAGSDDRERAEQTAFAMGHGAYVVGE